MCYKVCLIIYENIKFISFQLNVLWNQIYIYLYKFDWNLEQMFEIMDHIMYTNFCTLNDLISVLKTALWEVFSCFIKSRIILKLKIVNDLDE